MKPEEAMRARRGLWRNARTRYASRSGHPLLRNLIAGIFGYCARRERPRRSAAERG